MNEIEEHRIPIDSRTLYFTATGHGPPLVLVHGLSGSGRWWAKNMRELAHHFRVHVIDLPGFGGSRGHGPTWVMGGQFALSEAAQVLLRWMDILRLEQCHVIGHSMGGYICADLAAQAPERVDRMVLVDATALPIRQPLTRMALNLALGVRYVPPDFLPVLLRDSLRAGPLTLLGAIREIMNGDLGDALKKIQADLLIVWGEHDTLLPREMGEELQRQLPQAHFVVVPGAGHNPMWDRPAAFNALVTRFLRTGLVHE